MSSRPAVAESVDDGPTADACRPTSRQGMRLIGEEDHRSLLAAYGELAPLASNTESTLRAVLTDVVAHPGSFLRAQLGFALGLHHGLTRRDAVRLAIAVEYFHTASLLFDDLPMMDDARRRRGRPCPHRTWGEAAAVLAALALVNQAYRLVWEALAPLPAERSRRAAELVTSCLGAGGLLGGQARDLALSPESASAAAIRTVALEKTVPLIRLTLELPALVGGADAESLATLRRLATSWGLAYQILDDCRDALMGPAETGKTTDRDQQLGRPNQLHHSGPAATLARLGSLMSGARGELERLVRGDGDAGAQAWRPLAGLQELLETECGKIGRALGQGGASPGDSVRLEVVPC